jgi:hypothetical protein
MTAHQNLKPTDPRTQLTVPISNDDISTDTMATIITPAIQDELRAFCAAFASRRMMQPPEFTAHWRHFRDMYEQSYGGIPFATEQPWFAALITHGTTEDFAALIAVNDGRCDFRDAMIRCIIQNLLEEAWAADQRATQRGETVSTALPAWFRSIGARAPEDDMWNCMRPADASATDAEEATDPVVVDFAAVD